MPLTYGGAPVFTNPPPKLEGAEHSGLAWLFRGLHNDNGRRSIPLYRRSFWSRTPRPLNESGSGGLLLSQRAQLYKIEEYEFPSSAEGRDEHQEMRAGVVLDRRRNH
jgi:hypothetical protein